METTRNLYPFPTDELPDDLPNDEELNELRRNWERDLDPLTGFIPHERPGVFCVVLEDEDGGFHCHRYIRRLSGWDVSADGQRVSQNEALRWIAAPRAI